MVKTFLIISNFTYIYIYNIYINVKLLILRWLFKWEVSFRKLYLESHKVLTKRKYIYHFSCQSFRLVQLLKRPQDPLSLLVELAFGQK